MSAKLPKIVDLRVIGACDLRCPFCFGPRHEFGPVLLQPILNAITRFPSYGVEGIVVTGGEPTLMPDLPLVFQMAKSVHLKTVLSTNGIIFQRRVNEIAPYLDWVGLPLDADHKETNKLMRVGNPNHFRIILDLIPQIRKSFPRLRIKLGTVVSAINRDSISGMADLMQGERKPDLWKLYQVDYTSYGNDNRNMLELDDEEFNRVVNEIRPQAIKHGIRLMAYSRNEHNGKYLFFEPDGDAVVRTENGELAIGNFIEDLDLVVSLWHKYVNESGLESNFSETYPELGVLE